MSPEDRAWISRRLAEIDALVGAPHDRAELAHILNLLLASFATQGGGSEALMTARVAGYALALDGLPTWAIKTAAVAWLRGEVPDAKQFAPSPPELCRNVRALLAPLAAERADLRMLLDATEEDR